MTSLSLFEIDRIQLLHLEPSWRVTDSSNSTTKDAKLLKEEFMCEKNPVPKCLMDLCDFPVICAVMTAWRVFWVEGTWVLGGCLEKTWGFLWGTRCGFFLIATE